MKCPKIQKKYLCTLRQCSHSGWFVYMHQHLICIWNVYRFPISKITSKTASPPVTQWTKKPVDAHMHGSRLSGRPSSVQLYSNLRPTDGYSQDTHRHTLVYYGNLQKRSGCHGRADGNCWTNNKPVGRHNWLSPRNLQQQ